MKKISIVIPCYNAAEYLDRCMESILKQTIGLENIEIILVNDASTDEGATLSLMMEYEKKYPDNIIVIPLEQNMRQGGARNVGVTYAGGEYLMFCDADDWLMLDAMEILYHIALKYDADVVEFQKRDVMEIESEADVSEKYMGETTDIKSCIAEKIKCDVWESGEGDKNQKEHMLDYDFVCWNKMYRLRIIQENHIRFAEHLICEEAAFTLPVSLFEKKHVLIDAELYCYFQSTNSTMRSDWDDRKFDNLQVWMIIVREFEERGLFEKYYNELEYMFYEWGIWTSIRMLIAREHTLTVEEMNLFKEAAFRFFPGMLQNPYVTTEKESACYMLMQTLLETEMTEENVLQFNKIMRAYLQKWREIRHKC